LQALLPWEVARELVTKTDDQTDDRYGCRPEDRPLNLQIKYGIINLDKPPGPSSHEVVAWVKRLMKLSHAGHGGTLETS
jgi:H/ACA ribonucleoprotein complex subunit 4